MLKALEQIGKAEDLQEYQCKVVSFYETHLILVIRIHHPQIASSSWDLNFLGVYYFEGPIFWTGANFVNASAEVSKDAWRRAQPNLSDERIEQVIKIFYVCTVDIAPKPIVIAYMGVNVSKVSPY